MGKAYTEEMQQLPATIEWAAGQPVDLLRRAVQLYSDRGLLAVGSGGSFTGAALAAELHLRAYGQPSQAITPLDVFQLPAAASTYAAGMILSAEGKNHDVLAAAKQLLVRGCPAIGLTLRSDSPLVRFSDATGAASLASFGARTQMRSRSLPNCPSSSIGTEPSASVFSLRWADFRAGAGC